jgi:hypothetical protein
MGEFALHQGERIKIGTCENLDYLRADQAHLVELVEDDRDKALATYRFRFPWPDEDTTEPGAFTPHDRALPLPGMQVPGELADDHHPVQFVAYAGYLTSLPCPESGRLPEGIRVTRNGFAGPVKVVQQRYWEGRLVAVVRCGGCGLAWRLETLADAEPALRSLAWLAERCGSGDGRREWYGQVAERLRAGYELQPGELRGFKSAVA